MSEYSGEAISASELQGMEMNAEASAIAPRRQTLFELDEHLMLLLEHHDALLDEQAEAGLDTNVVMDIAKLLEGVEADIQKYSLALSKKVDGCAGVLRELEALTKLRKEEGERIIAMAKQSERAHDYLEGVILATMQAQKVKFYQGKINRLTCAGNGGLKPLVVTEPEKLTDDLKTIEVKLSLAGWIKAITKDPDIMDAMAKGVSDPEPWNAEIRKRLNAGEKVDGAHLADRGVHLLVK